MSKNFAVSKEIEATAEPEEKKTEVRISIPTLNTHKFKNVLPKICFLVNNHTPD